MIDRHGKCFVMAAAVLALVAVSAETALAKKNKVIATVNGKRIKWKGRYVVVSISGNGTQIIATKPARPGGTVRTVGFGCAIDPRNETTFPLTPPPEVCVATYTETKVSVGAQTNAWFAPNGANVTYDFDGTRLTGTFSVTLDPLGGSLPAVTIEGTFNTALE